MSITFTCLSIHALYTRIAQTEQVDFRSIRESHATLKGCTTFRHLSQPYFPISTAVFISLQRVLLSSSVRSLLYKYIAVLPAYVMADPVSVAGGAVGVISLAITTCQGVISYYDSWETQDQNVSDAKREIERLQSSLSALEKILPKISSSSAIAEHVKQCVLCCGEGTARLKQFFGKMSQGSCSAQS